MRGRRQLGLYLLPPRIGVHWRPVASLDAREEKRLGALAVLEISEENLFHSTVQFVERQGLVNLSPARRLLLLCQMPPVSKNKVCTPPPILRFLLYFNQVAGKILEKVYDLILMFPNNKVDMRPRSLFCDL